MKRTVVITGATKGIGRELVLKFAAENFQVAFCARHQKGLNDLRDEILPVKSHAAILAFKCDVTDRKQLKSFAAAVQKSFGAVDILINNAGVFIPGSVYNEKEGTLEKLMDVNLFSAYHLSRMLLPAMMKRKVGHIFNLSSVAGLKAYSNGGSYSITKFAMAGFSKALREEMKPHNIRVTTLFPGATLTDSWSGTTLPESRFMKAQDVAKLVFDIYSLSENSVVEEIVLRPVLGDI